MGFSFKRSLYRMALRKGIHTVNITYQSKPLTKLSINMKKFTLMLSSLLMAGSMTLAHAAQPGINLQSSAAEESADEAVVNMLQTAKDVIAIRGVGYPTVESAAYLQLSEIITAVEADPSDPSYAEILHWETINYKSATEGIQMPEDGKYYTITAVGKTGKELYINYNGEVQEVVVREEGVELPESAVFKFTKNEDGTYLIQTNDGKYLTHRMKTLTSGVVDEPDASTNITFEKIINEGAVEAGDQANLFGYVCWSSQRVDGTKAGETGYVVVKYTADVFDGAAGPYYNDNYTSALRLEEVAVSETFNGISAVKWLEAGDYTVNLTDAVVTYVNGKNAYIQDAEAGILYYKNNHGLVAGQKINGEVAVTLGAYQGVPQLTAMDLTNATVEEGAEIPVITLTAEEVAANVDKYEAMRVKIECAKLTYNFVERNATIEQNGTSLVMYQKDSKASFDLATDKHYDIVGYPGTYKGTPQINVWDVEDVVKVVSPLGAVIANLEDIDPYKAYVLYNPNYKAYAVYKPVYNENILWLAEAVAGHQPVNDERYSEELEKTDANSSWQLMKNAEGQYFLYNVGAKRYMVTPGVGGADENGGKPCRFVSDPVEVYVESLGDGKFAFTSSENDDRDYMCAGPQLTTPVSYWESNDAGSCWQFMENPNVEADKEAADIVTAIQQAIISGGDASVYTLSGVKLGIVDPKTLPAGLYIVNGKKVLVK